MRVLAKRILPNTLYSRAVKIYQKTTNRQRPRFTTMQSGAHPVLQCCIAYNRYGGYCVPLSSRHRPAAQMIYSGDVWEPETIDFLISNCSDGDIVHAGTYFGDFLPALSLSCDPNAKIWAFEPNPENYRAALITSEINGLPNVELTNAGLGEREGSLAMVTTDPNGRSLGGGSRILVQGAESPLGATELVQIVTVDQVVPSSRKVSIIQLDVERYELQVLSGALKTIRRWLPILILETLPEDSWLAEYILPLGYHVDETIHGNTVLVP